MTVSRVGAVAAVLGGLLWIVAGVMSWGEEPVNQSLHLAGIVLLVVALAALGYALVATAPVWLRAVVTVATPALGLMVWLILRDSLSEYVAAVTGGVLLLVGGGIALGRSRSPETRTPEPPPPARGRRAAR